MRKIALLLSVLGLLVATAAPAAGDELMVDEGPFDWFYQDAENQLIFITGPEFEHGCFGEGFTIAARYSQLEDDGTYTSRMTASDVRVALFAGFSSGPELIGAACGALAQGLPAPQPIAEGVGSWVYSAEGQTELIASSFDPPFPGSHIFNSARGVVTFADGSAAKVQGTAEHNVLADGSFDVITDEVVIIPLG